MKFTDTKLILSGSVIEVHHYVDKPLAYGFDASRNIRAGRNIDITDEMREYRKIESRKRTKRRARSMIRKSINANARQWYDSAGVPYVPLFVTLTFKDDIRDVEAANACFSLFIQRLNRIIHRGSRRCGLKYLAVIQFQDLTRDGVVHYHVAFFNLPASNANILSEIWSYGFVKRKEIKESNNVGVYFVKDLLLDANDDRLDGRKHYFSSNGLIKPTEIRDQNKAMTIIDLIPKEYKIEENNIDGHQGRVRHEIYQLDKGETLENIIPNLNNML
jgi:hypothetical protein